MNCARCGKISKFDFFVKKQVKKVFMMSPPAIFKIVTILLTFKIIGENQFAEDRFFIKNLPKFKANPTF